MATPANALAAINTLLKMGDGESPEVFTTLANVGTITGPTVSANVVDVTSHSTATPWREKIVTLLDAGEVSFPLYFIPSDTAHLALLETVFAGRLNKNWQLVFPDSGATTWAFSGPVTSFSVSEPVEGVVEASVTITITGQPDFSVE